MSHFPQEIITVVGRCAAPLPARPAVGAPGGGLPGWSPADRAIPESTGGACLLGYPPPLTLALLLPPSPPQPPSPPGKGEPKVISCKGLRPLHPRAEPGRHWERGQTTRPAGGLPFLSPANPDFSLLCCPHPPDPLPRREGGDQGYFMQGASPLASPGWMGTRHWLCLWKTSSFGVE